MPLISPYPTINSSVAQTLPGMIQYTNNVLEISGFEYSFGFGVVFATFALTFLVASGYSFKERLLYSSSISTFVSIMMAGLGVFKADFIGIMVVLTGVLLVLVYLDSR